MKRRLRPNTYEVLLRAVEQGVAFGWNGAIKHNLLHTPDPDAAKDRIVDEVMNAICEVFEFEEGG